MDFISSKVARNLGDQVALINSLPRCGYSRFDAIRKAETDQINRVSDFNCANRTHRQYLAGWLSSSSVWEMCSGYIIIHLLSIVRPTGHRHSAHCIKGLYSLRLKLSLTVRCCFLQPGTQLALASAAFELPLGFLLSADSECVLKQKITPLNLAKLTSFKINLPN